MDLDEFLAPLQEPPAGPNALRHIPAVGGCEGTPIWVGVADGHEVIHGRGCDLSDASPSHGGVSHIPAHRGLIQQDMTDQPARDFELVPGIHDGDPDVLRDARGRGDAGLLWDEDGRHGWVGPGGSDTLPGVGFEFQIGEEGADLVGIPSGVRAREAPLKGGAHGQGNRLAIHPQGEVGRDHIPCGDFLGG